MHKPLVPMFFPVLDAHMSDAELQYPDNSWKELTGIMAYLMSKSGDHKGQEHWDARISASITSRNARVVISWIVRRNLTKGQSPL